MDRMIYLAASGAKALTQRQEALTNNLANAGTAGFRADITAFRAVPVSASGTASTRVMALEGTSGINHAQGPVSTTGRQLDAAIRGAGWFVVRTPDGGDALTRNGHFQVGADGTLQSATGLPLVGDGGQITIPQNAEVLIGVDGTISARQGNQPPVQVGKLRLANPDPASLSKGPDGLIRIAGGEPATDDPAVRVASGAIEGSNVNVVESMVGMIELARQFEIQMKLLTNAEQNEQRAAQLLSLKG
jgi:flagellar basal-body rod protein FlgF